MSDDSSFQRIFREMPPARLKLYLLGPPRAIINGHRITGSRGEKAAALLAYLAVEAQHSHQRSELATMLWPERLRLQALQNLRQTLSRLRQSLEDVDADPPHLLVDAAEIQFNRRSDYWLDVEVFARLLAGVKRCTHRGLDLCPACLSQLAEAVHHYRGEFAATICPAGSEALDEWLLYQRETLRQQACDALYSLASSHVARGELDAAQEHVRFLLRIDHWHEAGHRLLLHVLTLCQGRNAAIKDYNAFRRALADELGVEPEDATQKLIAQIRAGRLPHP